MKRCYCSLSRAPIAIARTKTRKYLAHVPNRWAITLYLTWFTGHNVNEVSQRSILFIPSDGLRGFAKLKHFQKKKKKWKWVQVPFGYNFFLENRQKNKVLRLYDSPLLGGACGASRCACMQHFIPYSVIL